MEELEDEARRALGACLVYIRAACMHSYITATRMHSYITAICMHSHITAARITTLQLYVCIATL